MRMASSLFYISVLSIIIFIIDPSNGLWAIRPRAARTRRPQPSVRLNPLTRAIVDDAAGRQFRRSFRDDDDLPTDYFRFLLGDSAGERKRRSTSNDHFVPDYYDFMLGDEEWRTKRHHGGSTMPDYWDFVTGNGFRKKAETASEDLHNIDRKKTAVDGEGKGFTVEEAQQIKMGFGHGSAM